MTLPKPPQELSRKRIELRAQALSTAVVQAFTEKLKSEIHKHGGFLGIRHVDEIEAGFQAKTKELSNLFAKAFEEAAREQEELRWFSIKRPAFDRLVVKRFEHLFMHRAPDGEVHGSISRRLLPGFFLTLQMMLGPESMETFQRRSDHAVTRIMGSMLPIDWNLVDQDQEIRDILVDAQYTIAQYFDDVERRYAWFIRVANAHMAPPASDDSFDADWELTRHSLHLLVNSLLSDLKAVINDDQAWNRLVQRHPQADRFKLEIILDRLS